MKSKLFNYGSGHSRVFLEKGAYLPGRLTETGWKLARSFSMDTEKPIEYGEVVKFKDGDEGRIVVPLEAGDSIDDVAGIVVRTFNQIANVEYGANQSQFVYRPGKGQNVSVAVKGLIAVPVQKGEPAYGDKPLIRIDEDTTNAELPIGGIEAGSPEEGKTIEFEGATFRGTRTFPMTSSTTENTGNGTGQVAVIGLDMKA